MAKTSPAFLFFIVLIQNTQIHLTFRVNFDPKHQYHCRTNYHTFHLQTELSALVTRVYPSRGCRSPRFHPLSPNCHVLNRRSRETLSIHTTLGFFVARVVASHLESTENSRKIFFLTGIDFYVSCRSCSSAFISLESMHACVRGINTSSGL